MSEKIIQLEQTSQPNTQPNLHHRILGIMSELDYIEKGSAKVNGQYRFVSHDQVTAKVHPLLVKYGITVIPNIEDMTQDDNRTTIKIVFTFVNADNPQDNFSVRYFAHGIDGSDKGPGKAISYAYKYALLKTFCLETGDDPDNDANASYEPPKCKEFDSILPMDMTDKDKERLNRFLAYSSESLKKHVEDVKREALSRPEDFLKAFAKWKPKKEES